MPSFSEICDCEREEGACHVRECVCVSQVAREVGVITLLPIPERIHQCLPSSYKMVEQVWSLLSLAL